MADSLPRRVPRAIERRVRTQRARRDARTRGAGVILYYHRIAPPGNDPWDLCVSEASFDAQLEFLVSERRVLPLDELIVLATDGEIPEGAVAITFDDGYADNVELGLPLLEKHGVPATIYVATGWVGRQRSFWWDELVELLLGDGLRPATLAVEIAGTPIEAPTATRTERREALERDVHPVLRDLDPSHVDAGMDAIRAWAGKDLRDGPSSLGRPVTEDQLARLVASDAIALGAHTANHPCLPVQPVEAQRAEVETSRDYLTELVGERPSTFAFPYGMADATSRRVVRDAGFQAAVGIVEYMPLTAAARRFELPRAVASDSDGPTLGAHIDRVLAFRGWS